MSRTFPPRSPSDTRDPLSDFESEELERSPVDADPREDFSSESPELLVASRRGGDMHTLRYEIPLDRVTRPAPLASRGRASRQSTNRAIGTSAAVCVAGIVAFVMWSRASDVETPVPSPAPLRAEVQNAAPPAAVSPLAAAPPQGVTRVTPSAFGTASSAAAPVTRLPTDSAPRPASEAGTRPQDNPRRTSDSPAELAAAAPLGGSAAVAPSPIPVPPQPPSTETASVEPPSIEPVVPRAPPPPARAERETPAPVPPTAVEVTPLAPALPSRIDDGGERDEQSIQQVLRRYRLAYTQLDAAAAQAVWPSVDARGLSRAFDNLRSQELVFDGCELNVTGEGAEAICRGVATYVPKVGGQGRRVQGEWAFQLERSEGTWMIAQIEMR